MDDPDHAREQSLRPNFPALVTIVALLVIWYEILNRFPALWFVLLAPFILLCLAPFILLCLLVLVGLLAGGRPPKQD
jgi:hypothetical protein